MKKNRFIGTAFLFFFLLAAANAVPTRIRVTNSTGYEIKSLYIAPTSWDDWGENFLGDRNLPDGEEVSLTLTYSSSEAECAFDIRAIDVDGDEYAKYDINLCDDPAIVITFDDYVEPDGDGDGDEHNSYDEGYNAGYEEGLKAGRQEGFKEGYAQGFKDGFKEGSGKTR